MCECVTGPLATFYEMGPRGFGEELEKRPVPYPGFCLDPFFFYVLSSPFEPN